MVRNKKNIEFMKRRDLTSPKDPVEVVGYSLLNAFQTRRY